LFGALAVVGVLAVDASAGAATPARSANSTLRANKFKPRKGDYIINFSGTGTGSFSYSWPGFNNDDDPCYNAESYSMSYTYHWHWEDVETSLAYDNDVYSTVTGGGHTSSTTTYSPETGDITAKAFFLAR